MALTNLFEAFFIVSQIPGADLSWSGICFVYSRVASSAATTIFHYNWKKKCQRNYKITYKYCKKSKLERWLYLIQEEDEDIDSQGKPT